MGIHFDGQIVLSNTDQAPRPGEFRGGSNYQTECVAESRPMQNALKELDRIAAEGNRLLITGQPGTGKHLLVRRFHVKKGLISEALVSFDSKAPSLKSRDKIDIELFGEMHVTLFRREELKSGLIAKAEGGTLVVDNFEYLPADIQKVIADFLMRGIYYPVGSKFPRRGNVNMIFVSEAKQSQLKQSGRVVVELLGLLNPCSIELMPLRERKDDIIPLAEFFIKLWSSHLSIPPKRLSKDALGFLRRAPWFGNVSELQRVVLEALLFSKGDVIEAPNISLAHDGNIDAHKDWHLDNVALEEMVEKKLSLFFERLDKYDVENLYDTVISRVEKPLFKKVLEKTNGNQLKAARILGVNRNTLRSRLKELGIKVQK